MLAYSATRHSPTINEPGHLAAGLSHWRFGRFEAYCVNPPLVRCVAALPVMAAGYREDWNGFFDSPGARPEFQMGKDFIRANGERSIWLFVIARWACIPFALTGGVLCYRWSRELWKSKVAGIISALLWCFDPNILAHGELITPDCAAASLGLGAGYFFWRWLRHPSWYHALAAGILMGLAELTKATWILLFALWPLLWVYWLWTESAETQMDRPLSDELLTMSSPRRQLCWIKRSSQAVSIQLIALGMLNAAYGFDGTFTRLKGLTFVSTCLTGLENPGTPGNRLSKSPLGRIPIAVPAPYLRGIDLQKMDFERPGHASYLRGEWKYGGWWYYYLYGLAVKTPHGTQAVMVLACLLVITSGVRRRARTRSRGNVSVGRVPTQVVSASLIDVAGSCRCATSYYPKAPDLVVLLGPAVCVLVLVSLELGFNDHIRYVLPAFGFFFVFAGVTGSWLRWG
jgi:Dolichyl-phosphate-mannose-protein mannosyltransferase